MAKDTIEQWWQRLGPGNKAKLGNIKSAAARKAYGYYSTGTTRATETLAPAAPSAGTPAPGSNVPPPGAGRPAFDPNNPSYNAEEMSNRGQAEIDFRAATGQNRDGSAYGTGLGSLQKTLNDQIRDYDLRMSDANKSWTQNLTNANRYAAAAGRLRSGATQVARNNATTDFMNVDRDYGASGRYRTQAHDAYNTGMAAAKTAYDKVMFDTQASANERAINYQNALNEEQAKENQRKEEAAVANLSPGQRYAREQGWNGPWLNGRPNLGPEWAVFKRDIPGGGGSAWFAVRK